MESCQRFLLFLLVQVVVENNLKVHTLYNFDFSININKILEA